jgi:arabinogalactan endo-1,4-beta-galactosidase
VSGPGLQIRGADLSFVPDQEQAGVVFSDGGRQAPVEQLLARRGATHVRLRVWVDPSLGSSDRASVLRYARRIRAAGLELMLCLHYSDSWADPHGQATPRRWAGLGPAALETAVHDYTRELVSDFAAQGTPAAVVQVGNEIINGMLWPTGVLPAPDRRPTAALIGLVRAGVDGARAAGTGAQIAIHVHDSGDPARCWRFFDPLRKSGVDPDLIALSYYPFWNGPLSRLRTCVEELAGRYGTPVLIAETCYPWTLHDADGTSVVQRADQLPEGARYPPTPRGQAAFFEGLRALLAGIPDGRGAGFLVWEPAWLPGIEWQGGRGSPYSTCTLFDPGGVGLPALDCLRPPDGDQPP